MTEIMNGKQREINRAYSDAIVEALEEGYEACGKENGEWVLDSRGDHCSYA